MTLHVAPAFALVILELAPGSAEGVAQRHVRVLVSMVERTGAMNCDFLIRQCNADVEIVGRTLMLVTRQRLDDHMTAHDVLAELVESRGELTNASLQGRRGIHLTEGDLQWKYHVPANST